MLKCPCKECLIQPCCKLLCNDFVEKYETAQKLAHYTYEFIIGFLCIIMTTTSIFLQNIIGTLWCIGISFVCILLIFGFITAIDRKDFIPKTYELMLSRHKDHYLADLGILDIYYYYNYP